MHRGAICIKDAGENNRNAVEFQSPGSRSAPWVPQRTITTYPNGARHALRHRVVERRWGSN